MMSDAILRYRIFAKGCPAMLVFAEDWGQRVVPVQRAYTKTMSTAITVSYVQRELLGQARGSHRRRVVGCARSRTIALREVWPGIRFRASQEHSVTRVGQKPTIVMVCVRVATIAKREQVTIQGTSLSLLSSYLIAYPLVSLFCYLLFSYPLFYYLFSSLLLF